VEAAPAVLGSGGGEVIGKQDTQRQVEAEEVAAAAVAASGRGTGGRGWVRESKHTVAVSGCVAASPTSPPPVTSRNRVHNREMGRCLFSRRTDSGDVGE
jgi:hypothetical protein